MQLADKNKKTSPGRRPRPFAKGRQTDRQAFEEIKNLFENTVFRRDHLIEYLHQIQDTYNGISRPHIKALADLMKLSQVEVFEVASFYAHFDIVEEGEVYPPPLTIRVCNSVTCMMKGADQFHQSLKDGVDAARVRVVHAPCMGACDQAPVCHVGKKTVGSADISACDDIIASGDTDAIVPDYETLSAYQNAGGYQIYQACLAGKKTVEEIIDCLSQSGLSGLGGAGFPAGRKWQFVRSYQGPRLMTVNGDEGEPGTFKDRYYLETQPHCFLEGTLIGAWAVEAERIYIYIRDEYPAVLSILATEISALEDAGIIDKGQIELRRGAGAYICGEESAMIESIEGKRGLPRHRPPYIAEKGLFGRPTLNHNVETLYWIPRILEEGADWFASQGKNGAKGLRSWSVSGWVKKPGVILAPAGISVNELIDYAGGMSDGHQFQAYLPGGASGGILPARLGDLPLDFGSLDEYGCFVGSHAIVILSDQDNIPAIARNLIEFFEEESCGQCTPCRVGCEKASKLMAEQKWDIELLDELSEAMTDASICGLGQAAPNPIRSIMHYFREEIS